MTLKDIFTFLFIMGVFYLIGSFNALSFNPAQWGSLGRYMFSVMGTLVAVLLTVAIKFKEAK